MVASDAKFAQSLAPEDVSDADFSLSSDTDFPRLVAGNGFASLCDADDDCRDGSSVLSLPGWQIVGEAEELKR